MHLNPDTTHPGFPVWWPALIALLLASFLASIQLDDHAFNRDEPDSLYTAGIYSSGPGTLAEVWASIEDVHPTQAQGWSKLLFVWGRLVGWSEAAIRTLPFHAGLLALALIYRTGRDLFSPRAGLLAALLVSASVFFLAYMTIARGFSLVLLFTTLVLWSYCRLTLVARPAGPVALAALWLGAAGLLYSHYFASLFLPALVVFHLLLVPRNRRWWQVTLALALALPVALLQLPGFLNGLSITGADEHLADRAMTAAEIPGQFLYAISNFLFRMPWTVGILFIVSLVIVLVSTTRRRLRNGRHANVYWMLAFVTATALLIMLAANEAVRTMKANRIRYMLPLLPPLALLAGETARRYRERFPRTVLAALGLWLILGATLVLADYGFGLFRFPSSFHHVQRILQQRASADDLVVFEESLRSLEVLYLNPHYVPLSDQPWKTVFWEWTKSLERRAPVHSPYLDIWLVYPADVTQAALTPDKAPGRTLCETLDDVAGYIMERYGRAGTSCDYDQIRLEFDNNVQLTGSRLSLRDDLLRLEAGLRSADDYLLSHYTLALHVIDPQTGERVAQGDVGVGPGAFVRLRSDVDTSDVPPGDYELHVALYDWQTGDRLNARDLQTGAVSDIHVLHRFRIG